MGKPYVRREAQLKAEVLQIVTMDSPAWSRRVAFPACSAFLPAVEIVLTPNTDISTTVSVISPSSTRSNLVLMLFLGPAKLRIANTGAIAQVANDPRLRSNSIEPTPLGTKLQADLPV